MQNTNCVLEGSSESNSRLQGCYPVDFSDEWHCLLTLVSLSPTLWLGNTTFKAFKCRRDREKL